jgi:site-specific recombinase XerD
LKPKELNVQQGTLRVLHGKGDKYRLVGLDPDAMAILQRWLDKRKALGITGHKRIFCTLDGGPLSDRYARAMVKRMAKRAGVEKRVHPHGLRHTHAFELANEGFPVHEIQQQLGSKQANAAGVSVGFSRGAAGRTIGGPVRGG